MPEIVTHHFFAQTVLQDLPNEIRNQIDLEIWEAGVRGPDPLGVVSFYNPPVWKREHRKSNQLHTEGCGIFFCNLAEKARQQKGKERTDLFSFLSGFLTHYALDSICHPYIIYRTGEGKIYPGNHRSFEHAIDKKKLQEHGLTLTLRPISREILPRNGLPPGIKAAVDETLMNAFGWKSGWKKWNKALRDEMLFARLIEDPKGRFYSILRKLTANQNLLSLSYFEPAYLEADLENEQGIEWRNPYAPDIFSNQSLKEMENEACDRAKTYIREMYFYVFQHGSYPASVGNLSFESGLNVEDERNQQPLTCSVLPGRISCQDEKNPIGKEA